jgi:hypothetical protein
VVIAKACAKLRSIFKVSTGMGGEPTAKANDAFSNHLICGANAAIEVKDSGALARDLANLKTESRWHWRGRPAARASSQ